MDAFAELRPADRSGENQSAADGPWIRLCSSKGTAGGWLKVRALKGCALISKGQGTLGHDGEHAADDDCSPEKDRM